MPIFQLPYPFPLQSSWANISDGLEYIIIFICFEAFLLFVIRYFRSSEKFREKRNISWAIFFLGFGLVYLIYNYTDYIASTVAERNFWAIYAYFELTLAATLTIVISEAIERSKRRVFSILISILLMINIICLIFQLQSVGLFTAYLGIPLTLFYFGSYFYRVLKLTNFARQMISRIVKVFIAVIFVLIGYTLIADFFVELFGITIRIIADLFTDKLA